MSQVQEGRESRVSDTCRKPQVYSKSRLVPRREARVSIGIARAGRKGKIRRGNGAGIPPLVEGKVRSITIL